MTIDLNLPPKDKILKMLELMSVNSEFEWILTFLADDYAFNRKLSSQRSNIAWLKRLHRKYPGMTFSPLEILAEGPLVAVRWKLSVQSYKAHDGQTFGPGQFRGTNIMRFGVDGRLAANDQDDQSGKKRFFRDDKPDDPIDHIPETTPDQVPAY